MDEPASAAEAHPEPGTGREAVPERLVDVGDPGTVVLKDQAQPDPVALVDHVEPALAAAAILERVPGELAGGRDELRLVDEAEPEQDRARANGLADADDVIAGADPKRLGIAAHRGGRQLNHWRVARARPSRRRR